MDHQHILLYKAGKLNLGLGGASSDDQGRFELGTIGNHFEFKWISAHDYVEGES